MNESLAAYDNNATLLNLVRASRFEPLEFTSSGGIKGYNNFGLSLGLPTLIFGPHGVGTLAGARDYSVSTGITASHNADFSINTIDDPASYQALLTPINPSMIAFFINQGYPPEFLFHLLIDKFEIRAEAGSPFQSFGNTPFHASPQKAAMNGLIQSDQHDVSDEQRNYECFSSYVQYWSESGLTIQLDRAAVPGSKAIPAHRICFNPTLRKKQSAPPPLQKQLEDIRAHGLDRTCPRIERIALADFDATQLQSVPNCDTAPWTPAEIDNQSAAPGGVSTGDKHTAASNRVSRNDGTQASPNAAWNLDLGNGGQARFTFRSVYSVYQFLGQVIANGLYDRSLNLSDADDHLLLTVTNSASDCFAQVTYGSRDWCVPNYANNTKKSFGLLRQLVRLSATPTIQPQTQTVRVQPN